MTSEQLSFANAASWKPPYLDGPMAPLQPAVNMGIMGRVIDHNMPCSIYPRLKAEVDSFAGAYTFEPSKQAQVDGWYTVRAITPFRRWLLKRFFGADYNQHTEWIRYGSVLPSCGDSKRTEFL